jgi:hypothetical protein
MAVYPVGAPRYEFREGQLVRVVQMYNDATGQTRIQVQDPSAPADNEGYNEPEGDMSMPGADEGLSVQGDMSMPQNYGLPGPTDPFSGGRLGSQQPLTGYGSEYGNQQGYFGGQSDPYGDAVGDMSALQQGQTPSWGGENMMGQPNSLGPNATGAVTGPSGPMNLTGAPAATPGGDTQSIEHFRGLGMYNPEDPVAALENLFMDIGWGRGMGNPFAGFMKKAAPGMALDFFARNALGGAGTDVATAPYAFRDFLKQAIGGGTGGLGTGISSMLQTANRIPELIEMTRNVNQNLSGNIGAVNPFQEIIARALSSNEGQGTVGFLNNLLGPAMPSGLGDAYQSGLNARYRTAYRNAMGREGQPRPEGDIWTYLLGTR